MRFRKTSFLTSLLLVAGLVPAGAGREQDPWWAYQPVDSVAPPPDWEGGAIDYFTGRKLADAGLEPNGPADRRDLLRRVTYDLTGLPPTLDEIEAFEEADDVDAAYADVVDRLLASPHYGERWGRHWLDVVRFGESKGFEQNHIIGGLWPFRDYVIRSFNDDKPYDVFVREHLAGDVIAPHDPDVVAGAMFLVAGPHDTVGNQDPVQAAQIRANTIDEIVRATGEAFLGTTVGCARCHDHKFDPVSLRDYYQLYATFAGVKHGAATVATEAEVGRRAAALAPLEAGQRELRKAKEALLAGVRRRAAELRAGAERTWLREPVRRALVEEVFGPVRARHVRFVVEGQELDPNVTAGYRIDEFEVWSTGGAPRNVALATAGATAAGASRKAKDFDGAYTAALVIDGRFGEQWLAAGPELTITLATPELIDRVSFSCARSGDAGAQAAGAFVSEYRIEVSTDGECWSVVADSHDRRPVNDAHRDKRLFDLALREQDRQRLSEIDRQLAEAGAEIARVPGLRHWWVGTRDEIAGRAFHMFEGGSPERKGEVVRPASLAVIGGGAQPYELGDDSSEGARRLALADWITDPAHPLTARVMANRVWHYHFGRGLVKATSDFGEMGGEPSHPELLDWLAGELVRGGWRLKSLHRTILLSETYRRSAAWNDAAGAVDGESELLWRFPPRRLSAEEIRDTLLVIAGKLDTRMGGPGFRLYEYQEDNVATYVPLDEHGAETYRRAVYHQNARAAFVDGLAEFDSPDSASAAPVRATTTTPLQALSLMNHGFTRDMAKSFAERVEAAGGPPGDRVRRVYVLAYGRAPTGDESAEGVALVRSHGLAALCRAVLNTNELVYLD